MEATEIIGSDGAEVLPLRAMNRVESVSFTRNNSATLEESYQSWRHKAVSACAGGRKVWAR
jgi:hypothetical protein